MCQQPSPYMISYWWRGRHSTSGSGLGPLPCLTSPSRGPPSTFSTQSTGASEPGPLVQFDCTSGELLETSQKEKGSDSTWQDLQARLFTMVVAWRERECSGWGTTPGGKRCYIHPQMAFFSRFAAKLGTVSLKPMFQWLLPLPQLLHRTTKSKPLLTGEGALTVQVKTETTRLITTAKNDFEAGPGRSVQAKA